MIAIPTMAGARIFVSVPNAPGEVTSPAAFSGQVEALSVSFGYHAPNDPKLGKQGELLPAPITITKFVDKATPKLLGLGASFAASGKIVISQTAESFPSSVFMTVSIDGAVVTDWQMVTNGSGQPIEQVTFQPASVTVEYVVLDGNGNPGAKTSAKFPAK